ncbi:MAG: hypothetical protein ABSC11_05365 [Smithella sp.]|jgi:hypothetical protein
MNCFEKIESGISNAIVNNDSDQLRVESTELAKLLLDYDCFPEEILSAIIKIIQMPQFLKMQGSYILLNNIFDDVGILSDKQKNIIMNVLETIYERIEDITTCMFILEMIVNLSVNEKSLEVLSRLKNIRADVPKAMVAYGLYYLMMESHEKTLIKLAKKELMDMRDDHSEVVRKEVNSMLLKLAAKKVEPEK